MFVSIDENFKEKPPEILLFCALTAAAGDIKVAVEENSRKHIFK